MYTIYIERYMIICIKIIKIRVALSKDLKVFLIMFYKDKFML